MATRVACDEEGNGNSNEGNVNKGGGRAMATREMVTMWTMAMEMRLAGNKEGKSKGGKGNGDGNMRVAGKEEGKGSKAMTLATRTAGKWATRTTKKAMDTTTRVVGERWQQQQRGQ